MDIDYSLWNTLCQIVADGKKKDIDEKTFEKTFCELLPALGWLKLPHKELREQVPVPFANTNGIIDIMLIRKGISNPDVIIEMKKPNHTQKAKDVQQLCDYLKQKNCFFGLYVGEVFELFFYDINHKPTEKPRRVLSISYAEDCVEGQTIFDLLKRNTFDAKLLEKYCGEQLLLNDTANRLVSSEGKAEILDVIVGKTNLPEALAKRLRNMLLVDVRIKDSYSISNPHEEKLDDTIPVSPPKEFHKPYSDGRDHSQFSLDGLTYYPKTRFPWVMIKKYIELYPLATLDEIKQVMPTSSSTNSTILPKTEWLNKSPDAQRRYLRKQSEILEDANGVEFLVSTQWTYDTFYKKIVPLVEKLFHSKLHVKE